MNNIFNVVHNDVFLKNNPHYESFAQRCGLLPESTYAERSDIVLSRLTRFSPEIQICEATSLQEQVGPNTSSWVSGDPQTDKFVIKQAHEDLFPDWVNVGSLLQAYGTYIEQRASRLGYRNGRNALRNTSYDSALQLLASEKVILIDAGNLDTPKAANLLVGFLNGIWVARLCGFDPRDVASLLMMQSAENDVLASTYLRWEDAAAQAVTREVSSWLEEANRLDSEQELCEHIDAQTRQLLREGAQNIASGGRI